MNNKKKYDTSQQQGGFEITATQSKYYDIPHDERNIREHDDNKEEGPKRCAICGKEEGIDFILEMTYRGPKGSYSLNHWYFCEKHARHMADKGMKIDYAIQEESEAYSEGNIE